ncbi:MAG: protein phosphatase 2C domain-containing protein [Gemmataceae bacterium]
MLARLRGMIHSAEGADNATDSAAPNQPEGAAVPEAIPVATPPGNTAAPVAIPVTAEAAPVAEAVANDSPAVMAETPPAAVAEAAPASPAVSEAPAVPQHCPICSAVRQDSQPYCMDCGFLFPATAATGGTATPQSNAAPEAGTMVKGRYLIGEMIWEREGVCRYRGQDRDTATPVVILRGPAPAPIEEVEEIEEVAEMVADDDNEDILPDFDMPSATPELVAEAAESAWPNVAWERELLTQAQHPALPRILDSCVENGFDYLIEEVPAGQVLWDAWDDPTADSRQRYGWLKQIAEGLKQLHAHGAILEALRPDLITIREDGQAVVNDLSDLLPLPLPPHPPLRASLYTPPDLILNSATADARAALYSFGATVYSLNMGRELTEMDFERQGVPKPFIARFPDVHPLLARLLFKTFHREVAARFPTDEAAKQDATGFSELIRALEVCQQSLDHVRLEMASWTTTGIVRTGNEDAFGVMHVAESNQDDFREYALVLLADGMGGYEAGEIASVLAIQTLRKYLLQQEMFSALAGGPPPAPEKCNIEDIKKVLLAALKEANKVVYEAPQKGIGRRGMGCTAEVVYIDGYNIVIGHVGDSRTYLLSGGHIKQLTRDQTLVNRLVELGQLTPEEAETHPRRSELQQAIGGRPFVEPDVYHAPIKAGDWVLVCSDGLTNHVKNDELREMLQLEAGSAQIAARRLVNLVNMYGATDNSTVVVVRAT